MIKKEFTIRTMAVSVESFDILVDEACRILGMQRGKCMQVEGVYHIKLRQIRRFFSLPPYWGFLIKVHVYPKALVFTVESKPILSLIDWRFVLLKRANTFADILECLAQAGVR